MEVTIKFPEAALRAVGVQIALDVDRPPAPMVNQGVAIIEAWDRSDFPRLRQTLRDNGIPYNCYMRRAEDGDHEQWEVFRAGVGVRVQRGEAPLPPEQ